MLYFYHECNIGITVSFLISSYNWCNISCRGLILIAAFVSIGIGVMIYFHGKFAFKSYHFRISIVVPTGDIVSPQPLKIEIGDYSVW